MPPCVGCLQSACPSEELHRPINSLGSDLFGWTRSASRYASRYVGSLVPIARDGTALVDLLSVLAARNGVPGKCEKRINFASLGRPWHYGVMIYRCSPCNRKIGIEVTIMFEFSAYMEELVHSISCSLKMGSSGPLICVSCPDQVSMVFKDSE